MQEIPQTMHENMAPMRMGPYVDIRFKPSGPTVGRGASAIVASASASISGNEHRNGRGNTQANLERAAERPVRCYTCAKRDYNAVNRPYESAAFATGGVQSAHVSQTLPCTRTADVCFRLRPRNGSMPPAVPTPGTHADGHMTPKFYLWLVIGRTRVAPLGRA